MRLSSLCVCVVVLGVVGVSSGPAQRREPGAAKERGEAKEPGERKEDADDDKGPEDAGPAMGLGAGMAGAVHPLMQALDADGDGVISAKEIKSAAKALKSLDANRDGKLTQDELAPGLRTRHARCRWRGRSRRARRNRTRRCGRSRRRGIWRGRWIWRSRRRWWWRRRSRWWWSRWRGRLRPTADQQAHGIRQEPGRATRRREELPEQYQPMFQRLDMDGNGSVDIRELRAAAARGNPGVKGP